MFSRKPFYFHKVPVPSRRNFLLSRLTLSFSPKFSNFKRSFKVSRNLLSKLKHTYKPSQLSNFSLTHLPFNLIIRNNTDIANIKPSRNYLKSITINSKLANHKLVR